MRRRFNDGRYVDRAATGELTSVVMDSRPAPEGAGQPPGTLSQMISYRDRGDNEVARAHQYLRPDGTLGGSGRPDPKRLFEDGILYRLVKKRNRETATNPESPLGYPTG